MKLKIRIVTVALLLAAAAILPTTLYTGCSGQSTQKITVNTLATVHTTAEASYKTYLNLVLSKQVATNGVPAVTDAYREFQTAFNAAVDLAHGNSNAPPSQALLDSAAKLTSTIDLAK